MESDFDVVPHYFKPTLTSSLPPYLHGEIERVQNSFKPGSLWAIKKLPHNLAPGEVLASRKHQTQKNLRTSQNNFVIKSCSKKIPIVSFMHSDYSKFEEVKKRESEEKKVEIESFSRKPFLYSTTRHKSKYEDIFENRKYVFPHATPAGSQTVDLTTYLRNNSNNNTSNSTPFLNAGKSTRPPSLISKEFIKKLIPVLDADWKIVPHRVICKGTEEILIIFDFSTQINPQNLPLMPSQLTDITSLLDVPSLPPGSLPPLHTSHSTPNLTSSLSLNSSSFLPPPPPSLSLTRSSLHRYMTHLAYHGLPASRGFKKRIDRWGNLEIRPTKMREAISLSPQKQQSNTGEEQEEVEEDLDQPGPLLLQTHFPCPDHPGPSELPQHYRFEAVYSLLPPWSHSMQHNVQSSVSRVERDRAREMQTKRDLEKRETQKNEEKETYGTTLNVLASIASSDPLPGPGTKASAFQSFPDPQRDATSQDPFAFRRLSKLSNRFHSIQQFQTQANILHQIHSNEIKSRNFLPLPSPSLDSSVTSNGPGDSKSTLFLSRPRSPLSPPRSPSQARPVVLGSDLFLDGRISLREKVSHKPLTLHKKTHRPPSS